MRLLLRVLPAVFCLLAALHLSSGLRSIGLHRRSSARRKRWLCAES